MKGYINSRSLRCCTARGFSAGFSQVSPTKVEASKSFSAHRNRIKSSNLVLPHPNKYNRVQ